MTPPKTSELIAFAVITVGATISWLWLARPHDLHDALLVLLSGVAGIVATMFVVGLMNRFYKGDEKK